MCKVFWTHFFAVSDDESKELRTHFPEVSIYARKGPFLTFLTEPEDRLDRVRPAEMARFLILACERWRLPDGGLIADAGIYALQVGAPHGEQRGRFDASRA